MPVNFESFKGEGSTKLRKAFWDKVTRAVNESSKRPGRNVSVDEREGSGTIVNVIREKPTGSPCVFVQTIAIVDPGSGYIATEIIHPGGGDLCPPADNFGFGVQIDAVDGGGGVTAVTLIPGIGYLTPPTNPISFFGAGDNNFTANCTFA